MYSFYSSETGSTADRARRGQPAAHSPGPYTLPKRPLHRLRPLHPDTLDNDTGSVLAVRSDSQLERLFAPAGERDRTRTSCSPSPLVSLSVDIDLLDHLIRPQKQRLRDRQAQGFRGLQIEDQLGFPRFDETHAPL